MNDAAVLQRGGQKRPPVSWLLLTVYNFVFFLGFICYLPLFVWRMIGDRSYRRGLRERTGRVAESKTDNVIWIHGVSVGEIKAAAPLVQALREASPKLEIVISSTTPTGGKVARSLFPNDRVIVYPLDFAHFPARALERVRPRAVLLMELELWPNFLHAAERRQIPVVVVNGRISDRSYRGYSRVSWLLPQIDRIDLFAVQNETYAGRLRALGVSPDRICITGNMKYDRVDLAIDGVPRDPEFDALLQIADGELVVVGGSTHPGEEEKLGRALLQIEERDGMKLRLVVAPRHPERCGNAVDDLMRVLDAAPAELRRPVHRLTDLRNRKVNADPRAWLVIDTIGELENAYSIADAVFVGGSLVKHGGQNMLEPVALGKPTLVGPHCHNFADDVRNLLEGEGLIRVSNDSELRERLARLLRSPEEGQELIRRGHKVLAEGRGATERTFRQVSALLAEYGVDLFESGVDHR